MIQIRTTLLASILLAALGLLVTGCGTFEVHIEHAATTATAPLATATPTPHPVQAPRTPTATAWDAHLRQVPAPDFTPAPASEYAAPAGLRIAFGRSDQVWLWAAEDRETTPLAAASSTNDGIRISDDGAIIAFTRGNEWWAVSSDGTGERRLLGVEDLKEIEPVEPGVTVHGLEWVPGSHILAFNTRLVTAHGLVLNHDLHLLDADTLQRTQLLPPGEGGEFHFSPKATRVAIVTPGEIHLLELESMERQEALTYTPVNTGSEYAYYARPAWAQDGSALQVAIPPADPFGQPLQNMTIWHIPTDGTPAGLVTSLAVVPLLGPDVLAFSPDLQFVAYAKAQGAQDASQESTGVLLEVQRLADGAWQAHPEAGALFGWAPDSRRFAFVAGGETPQLLIGQWSGETLAGSIEIGTPVYDVRWVDDEHYLFVAQRARARALRRGAGQGTGGDSWDLILGGTDGSSTILASIAEFPRYDFAVVPPPGQGAAQPVTPVPLPRSGQQPTQTPVAPVPGLVYEHMGGLWSGMGQERVQLLNVTNAHISRDGTRALYLHSDQAARDAWLADLANGERQNLTGTPERVESDPRWWPARPEVVLMSSLPLASPLGSGVSGYLTAVGLDGNGYRILDDEHPSFGPPAPSPDGEAIAYGGGSSGWLYHWDSGPQAFDPADYGLPYAGELEISHPAWAPDGRSLAWIIGGDLARDGRHRWGVAAFDLEAGSGQILYTYEAGGGDGWPPAPVWSPDGRWLAFAALAQDADLAGVWVVQVDREEKKAYHLGGHDPVWRPDGQWLALSGTVQGQTGHWLANVGSWTMLALDLPPGARVVDWITFDRRTGVK
jgi:Tol biopolymer transport system component